MSLISDQTDLSRLEPGELIEFPRGIYSHWAVYIGNEEVIHVYGEDDVGTSGSVQSGSVLSASGKMMNKAKVRQDKFRKVAKGGKALRNNKKDDQIKPLSSEEIVKNAKSLLGHEGYNVLISNCEHFANLCRYGVSQSDQVDKFMKVAAEIICAFLGLLSKRKKNNERFQHHDKSMR